VPACEIPNNVRLKQRQIEEIDHAIIDPYPGWRLILSQGRAGWKVRIGTPDELAVFSVRREGES
jgi:hypothetical protein